MHVMASGEKAIDNEPIVEKTTTAGGNSGAVRETLSKGKLRRLRREAQEVGDRLPAVFFFGLHAFGALPGLSSCCRNQPVTEWPLARWSGVNRRMAPK